MRVPPGDPTPDPSPTAPSEEPPPAPAEPPDYDALIAREARHWASVDRDPENPQLWDEPALAAIALAPAYAHLLDRAAAAGGPVLELGCGDGDLAMDLARRGLIVVGVDLAPERIERARAQARTLGVETLLRFEVADLNRDSLPTGPFRCVVAHDALHHILELDALLDRVRDALVPDGRLLVSDFIGAGAIEKLATAAAVALLPTAQPYARKWRLRRRAAAQFASERSKREALSRGEGASLHDASPFEGISQESIEARVRRRFDVVERFTFCPYWYHAVPKLRMPPAWRRALLAAADRVDRPLHHRGWTRGSYVFLEATPRRGRRAMVGRGTRVE